MRGGEETAGSGFGLRFRRLRDELRLPREVVAARVGRSKNWLLLIETAGNDPTLGDSLELLKLLAERGVGVERLGWVLFGSPEDWPRGRVPSMDTFTRRQVMARLAAMLGSAGLGGAGAAAIGPPIIERLGLPLTGVRVTPELIAAMRSATDGFFTLRQAMTPNELLPIVERHAAALHGVFRDAAHPELGQVYARTAALAGWMAGNVGDVGRAQRYLEAADQVAEAIGDSHVRVFAAVKLADFDSPSQGRWDGSPTRAQARLDQAVSLLGSEHSAELRTWALLRRGEELAFAGDVLAAHRALDDGAAAAGVGPYGDDLRGSFSRELRHGDLMLSAFSASYARLLGQWRDAARLLDTVVATQSPKLSEGWGATFCDLGAVQAQLDNVDASVAALTQAVTLAGTVYPQHVRRARGVRAKYLARWANEPAVRQLDELLAT